MERGCTYLKAMSPKVFTKITRSDGTVVGEMCERCKELRRQGSAIQGICTSCYTYTLWDRYNEKMVVNLEEISYHKCLYSKYT